MNPNRICVPALVLLGLALQPRSRCLALDVIHNTNASTATSGLPPASDERNGVTPNGHVIRVATIHTAADAHGRWVPGSLVSGISLSLRSTPSTSASGQGADQLYLQAHDLVFSSSDPQATQAVIQMHVHVTWTTQMPPINCGDVNDCNVPFVANTGAGVFVDGQLGSAGCQHSFCGQPSSGSSDFVTPAATVALNSPFSPTFQASSMSRVQLCAGDFVSNSVAEISLSFPDPVFDLPPGVTANSPDLGIVDNHWIGASGCASILSNPANASVADGSPASFHVSASGSDTLYFQWYHDGVALTDGGTLSGSTTSTLSISSAAGSDSGLYSVALENGCAPDTSAPAKLTVGSSAGVAAAATGACNARGSSAWARSPRTAT